MKSKITPAEAPSSSSKCPTACAMAGSGPNLTWLLHRATQVMGAGIHKIALGHGLEGPRDCLVVIELCAGTPRTQLELAQAVGLDKTTLTAVLDRLEKADLVVRRIDPANRRARFPEITDAGRELAARITQARRTMEDELLGKLPAAQRDALLQSLQQIIAAGDSSDLSVTGSCM